MENDPCLRAMIAHVGATGSFPTTFEDQRRMREHDPSDVRSRLSVRHESHSRSTYFTFAGNSVRMFSRQAWFDENGCKVEVPGRLTATWQMEQARGIADQIRASGRRSEACEARGTDSERILKQGNIAVVVPNPHFQGSPSRAFLGEIETHWLTVRVMMRLMTGNVGMREIRIDSIGRSDIGARIASIIRQLEDSAPGTPEEAQTMGLEAARQAMVDAFSPFCIEPDIVSIERHRTGGNDLAYKVRHLMTGTALGKREAKTIVTFHGNDPRNVWKPMLSSYGGGKTDEASLSAEASRRHNIAKNGGLMRTSLARNLLKLGGQKDNPFQSYRMDGTVSAERLRFGTNTETRADVSIRNGRIEATMKISRRASRSDDIRITTGTFRIPEIDVPEAMIAGMKGRRLREIIEHPALSDDIVITSALMKGRTLEGRLRMDSELVPMQEPEDEDE